MCDRDSVRTIKKHSEECLILVLYVLKGFADLCFDLVAKLDVVGEEVLDSLSSLCELAFAVAEP